MSERWLLVRPEQEENAYGRFADELLRAEGLNGFQVTDIGQSGIPCLAPDDIAVLTRCFLRQSEIEALCRAVEAGARLLCLHPPGRLAARLGWRPLNEVIHPGRVRARGCYRGAGAAIPVHVPIVLCDPPTEAEVVADAIHDDGTESGFPAVARQRVGAGEVTFFFYDLAKAVSRIRFGDPDLASMPTSGAWDWPHARDLLTGFADPTLRQVPTSDLQTQLLAQLLTLTSPYPLARCWYYERASHRTGVVFSSDDDWSLPDQFRRLSDALAKRGATATFYLVRTTNLGDAQIADLRRLGHTFGPHVNATGDDEMCFAFPQSLAEESDLLRNRIGQLSATLQTHCAPWYGYVSYAQACRRHGYRMLMHYISAPAQWLNGFMCGSGRPVKFVDLDGAVLDCWQQPCITYDDSSLQEQMTEHPQSLIADFARTLEGCLGEHHSAIGMASHPVSFDTYSAPFIEGCLDLVVQAGAPIYNADQWCSLQDRRHAVNLRQRVLADGLVSCVVSGPSGALSIMFPRPPGGDPSVRVSGQPVECAWHHRLGEERLFVDLDGRASADIEVEVQYEAR